MAVVVREMPSFRHDLRAGAFRRWLRNIMVNRLRVFWRGRRSQPVATGNSDFEQMLDQLADSDSHLSKRWDQEHDQHVIRRLLELIRPEFEPATWRAFQLLVLEGRKTADAAVELHITPNAVRIGKSRVLSRLGKKSRGWWIEEMLLPCQGLDGSSELGQKPGQLSCHGFNAVALAPRLLELLPHLFT